MANPKVLIVDDDRDMRWAIRNVLADAGFEVEESDGGGTALTQAASDRPAVVLLDMYMPGLSGDVVLRSLKRLDPRLPIIVVTAHGTIPAAIRAIRDGAFEYVTKPFRNDHLVETVRRAVECACAAQPTIGEGVGAGLAAAMGQGPAIQALIADVRAVVSTGYSVVIGGETGSGKEVVARSLHEYGPRAKQPLVVIDCGAIAETLPAANSSVTKRERSPGRASDTAATSRKQPTVGRSFSMRLEISLRPDKRRSSEPSRIAHSAEWAAKR